MFKLSKREIIILTAGSAFVFLFLVYRFGIEPAFEKRERLKTAIVEKQAALQEMSGLQEKYKAVSNRFDQGRQAIAGRKKGFSLFSFLDTQVRLSGIKENVAYMKPSTQKVPEAKFDIAVVKLKLSQVYLKDLVDFIRRVEGSANSVLISSLSLNKAGKQMDMLDAVIETQTFILPEKS